MERTIVLVDDHSLFRNGLRGLLEHCAGCRVVGEAASGEEFLAMLPELEADIVFMDFAMPGIDGAQATERALARRPELRIITLSMFGEESYYTRMVQAGARGFLLKDSDIGDVVEAIDTVMAGGSYFSPQLLSSLAGRLRTREDAPDEDEDLIPGSNATFPLGFTSSEKQDGDKKGSCLLYTSDAADELEV